MDIIKKLLATAARRSTRALRAQVPYRTKLDRGGDGVLGAGTTPLLRAAKAGDVPVIKLLLEKGANPKAATRNGVNAIMMAANVAAREEDMTGRNKTQKEAIESITLLLAAGHRHQRRRHAGPHGRARRRAVGPDRRRARSSTRTARKLDIKDKRGYTPLDTALGTGRRLRLRRHAWRRARGDGQSRSANSVASRDADSRALPPVATATQDDPQDGDRN